MLKPNRIALLAFIRQALIELQEEAASSGDDHFSIRNIEALDTMDAVQLSLLASVILALGYEPA